MTIQTCATCGRGITAGTEQWAGSWRDDEGYTGRGGHSHNPIAPPVMYSDEWVTQQVAKGGGFGRAAGYLGQVADPEIRRALDTEGNIQANMIGGRYADAVHSVVQAYLSTGKVPDTYTRRNREIIEDERRERAARNRAMAETGVDMDGILGPVVSPLSRFYTR